MTGSGPATAFVFPGQGSQRPDMGRPFHAAWPETRRAVAELDAALGGDLDLRAACFGGEPGNAGAVRGTARVQPAVFAVGLATARGLRERTGIEPAAVAGHSLGHLTALAESGVFDPVTGIELARDRGRVTAEVAREGPEGAMLAVLLADSDTVAGACADHPRVSVAARNAPRETVISGPATDVAAVRDHLDQTTRARFRELDTETAFHSPLLKPARDAFGPILGAADLSAGEIPVVSDVSDVVYTAPAVARRELRSQLTATVDWIGAVGRLRGRGIERFVELPPAGTLGPLIERIDGDATVLSLESPEDAEVLL